LIAAAAALPVAVASVRRRGSWAMLAERAAFTGFALPGIVFGLAFVHLSVRYAPLLYQTLPLLVLAYTLHFLPQAVGAQRGSLLQIDPQLEEAGRSLGRSPFAVFRSVTLPLAAPGILAGWLLVFLTTVKELPATLLLAPAGFQTLATRIWSLTEEAHYAPAAVHAVFLIALSGGVTVAVLRLARNAEALHP